MSLKDDLIAARALIDTPEKWVKGKYEVNGCYCAMGAVSMAVTGSADYDSNWYVNYADKVVAALDNRLPARFPDVAAFNDDPATTHNDVLQLFDRAIEAAS
jgi:hypothetical protein